MALSPEVKKNWIEIQKKHTNPVNAIGMPIHPTDSETMKVWKEEGIDAFMQS